MYKLRKGVKNGIGTKKDTSQKLQKGVNLYEYQWSFLDQLADQSGKSRNQVLRDLLEDYFSRDEEFTEFKKSVVVSTLEKIYAEATSTEVKQAVNKVEEKVGGLDTK
jgi:metal-responsive CopG/Arc/MetJ family transcriptional regulator